jgi:23S rRNA pseudouridine955/2504/2580 synthase/23S rRNA pseudouridine1911/1915/1917 synthase
MLKLQLMLKWEKVYEDQDVLLINKPSGLPVLPERWEKEADCLYAQLAIQYPDIATAHRIDKETSGLILWVKNHRSAQVMSQAFSEGTVKKIYHALIHGRLPNPHYLCTSPLRVDGNRQHQTVVDIKNGVEARTEFIEMERFKAWSWVEARIYTGRTHQIRVHAAAAGCPLVGDPFYGGKVLKLSMFKRNWKGNIDLESPLLERVGLHAAYLAFDHPSTGVFMEFSVIEPKDLLTTLKQLRNFGR